MNKVSEAGAGIGWFPTDLLGHPVPANKGAKARPQHAPTAENLEIAMLLYAEGRTDADVAAAIGITPPTLRRHYFSSPELKRIRRSARMVVQGQLLLALAKAVAEGKVAAIDKMLKRMDKVALGVIGPVVKAAKKGLKEKRVEEGRYAGAGDEEWGPLLGTSGLPN